MWSATRSTLARTCSSLLSKYVWFVVCFSYARLHSFVAESGWNSPFLFFSKPFFRSVILAVEHLLYWNTRGVIGPHVLLPPFWLWFLSPQADLQRIYWPAHTGPVTAGKLEAGAHLGARNPGLPDSFQPHHSWIWFPSHLRRNDLPPELPKRGAQASGQNVLEFWQWNPCVLGEWEQVHRQNGQAQEMRALKEKTRISESQNTLSPAALFLFWTYLIFSITKFESIFLFVGVYVCFWCKFLENCAFVTIGCKRWDQIGNFNGLVLLWAASVTVKHTIR